MSVFALDVRRRRLAYLCGVAVALPAMLATWLAQYLHDPVMGWAYPLLTLALLGAGLTILVRPQSVPRVERATLLVAASAWLVRLGVEVYVAPTADAAWVALTPWAFMGICLIAVFGYIVLPTKRAVLVGAGFALAAAALMVPRFVADARASGDWSTVVALLRYETYLAVTLAFMHVLASSKDKAIGAELEAERMRTMAYRDPLTGLPNRRALSELLDREVDHSRRSPLSVIAFDLDQFKRVNDTFGHHSGDLVLQATALCVQNGLRAGDTVGRWGGEEFLVVAPGSAAGEATELAHRLRAVLEEQLRLDGFGVTGSFGVVQYRPGMSVASLLATADTAMYEAKVSGRNRVVSVPLVLRARAELRPLVEDVASMDGVDVDDLDGAAELERLAEFEDVGTFEELDDGVRVVLRRPSAVERLDKDA